MADLLSDYLDANDVLQLFVSHIGRLARGDVQLALEYWRWYPFMSRQIYTFQAEGWNLPYRRQGQGVLNDAYIAATGTLMRAAAKAGLNPHDLQECSCVMRDLYWKPYAWGYEPDDAFRRGWVIRELYYSPPILRQLGVLLEWPDCMRPAWHRLSSVQQEALRRGEYVFVCLDTGPNDTPTPGSDVQPTNDPLFMVAMKAVLGDGRGAYLSRLIEIAKKPTTVEERLTKIGKLGLLRPDVSAKTLGDLLGVSPTAVKRTSWWRRRMADRRQEAAEAEAEYYRKKSNHRSTL